MKQLDINKHREWYETQVDIYEDFGKLVRSILKKILESKNITFHGISHRTKSVDSFVDKIKRKKETYEPKKMTDLSGIRVIAYILSDVDKIVEQIKKNFQIDKENSVDKSEILGDDKVGYQSKQYIVLLSKSRLRLQENKRFKDLKCEIQVRTILQHAWAEIEHDRKYKTTEKLPDGIPRRFNLIAGLLEVADSEFEQVTDLINEYTKEVKSKTKSKKGRLDVQINSISLIEYLLNKFKDAPEIGKETGSGDIIPEIIGELNDLGIKTLEDLEKSIPKGYVDKLRKHKMTSNFAGVMRDIMIITFKEKYFKKAWKTHWDVWGHGADKFFEEYNVDIKKLIGKYVETKRKRSMLAERKKNSHSKNRKPIQSKK